MAAELRAQGIRVNVDDRSEKLGYKIREAQVQKIPYMIVVGDKEVDSGEISVRHRHAGDLGATTTAALGEKIARLAKERATNEEAVKPGGVQ